MRGSVYFVGRIRKEIYQFITSDCITDEVIITEERIEHIKERHPTDFERYNKYLEEIIGNPDYIIDANKSNTAILLKEIIDGDSNRFKLVLRIAVKDDPVEYRNSVISFWHIGETTWNKMLKNKKILYSKE